MSTIEVMKYVENYTRESKEFDSLSFEQKNILMPMLLYYVKPKIKEILEDEEDEIYLSVLKNFIDETIKEIIDRV